MQAIQSCRVCKRELPATPEYFVRKFADDDSSIIRDCRECSRAARRAYFARNKEKEKAARERYLADPENRAKAEEYRRRRWQEAQDKLKSYMRDYREKNKNKLRKKAQDQHRKFRLAALAAYGGRCACCGESTTEFLAIDHVRNDGHLHRKKERGARGGNIYRWLAKQNYPQDGRFQVLCHNCNVAKGLYGGCPHNGPVPNMNAQTGTVAVNGRWSKL